MSDDDKIKKLPVRFKSPAPPDRTFLHPFEVRAAAKCWHNRYIVDPEKALVECAECHEQLNPIWVLQQLCNKDHQYWSGQKRYADEMARLSERSKTKCRHCGKMTEISRS